MTGDVGRHGTTILLARGDYGIDAEVTSDCAPLWNEVEAALGVCSEMHVIRDATRGGVGTVMYEITEQSDVGVKLDREKIPVDDAVRGVTGMLGLEPLYLACEGTMVMICPAEYADKVVEALHGCEHGKGAAIIGEITEENKGRVVMTTEIGGMTYLPKPGNELLPRIC